MIRTFSLVAAVDRDRSFYAFANNRPSSHKPVAHRIGAKGLRVTSAGQ